VGRCLHALEKEGLLVYKRVDPEEHDSVSLHRKGTITWVEGRWVWGYFPLFQHKGFGNYKKNGFYKRRDPRKLRSKKDIAKAQKKNGKIPVQPEDWDGKAYHIVRGLEFKKACKALGLPDDPEADWTCPQCGNKCRYDRLDCSNYKLSPPCAYKRPHQFYWPPPPVKLPNCKRCGCQLKPGVKHKENACNTNIVSDIMNS
jgi:hypothetical protein